MKIKKLPDNVIKLIAAGEVIDSLTAVVRELVENSLDAKANRIVVSLYPQSWSVQVADNGEGIAEEDLPLTIQPHTTSKIFQAADLSNIHTLGFRGEALHSIAQFSTITIASRIKDSNGWAIKAEKGKIVQSHPHPMALGTIVTVSDLFANTPVRRQVSPPFKKQLKKIQILLGEFALCHPHVTWQLLVDGRLVLAVSSSDSPKKIFPQLVSSFRDSDLQFLEKIIHLPDGKCFSQLKLVAGLPDRLSRPRPDWIKVGINGRVVRCPELETAIYNSYHHTLERDRFPVAFVDLRIPPQQIDWNRHPAKAEIYLDNISFWQQIIQDSLAEVFRLSPNNISQRYFNKKLEDSILKLAENKVSYNLGGGEDKEEEKKTDKETKGLIKLKAVAQVRNTYIVAEYEEGIWLIEQHIAHERVLYEQLKDNWEIVPLETPIILGNLQEKQVEQLENIGLEVENFGPNLWAVRSIPKALLNRQDWEEALLELSQGGDLDYAIRAVACRTAIRNGQKLSLKQMQQIVDDWIKTKNPHTCPHGRPIYLPLEESSLFRYFRRHWVLGISHGITESPPKEGNNKKHKTPPQNEKMAKKLESLSRRKKADKTP
ncbi:MAG: DNA mismatch repair endonuclease MutL [Geminocystis sp.]|nr:DNA mismatch repair endonuclease MutL [Geminocystis sp.]